MFSADDINKKRTDISNAIEGSTYYCPICEQEMIQKKGEIKAHHFAHKHGKAIDCDGWNYDMSEWHRNWQLRFPEECREVVVKNDKNEMHRADILVGNVVIEFQHSAMTPFEFDVRTDFYLSLGYSVVWLFDVTEEGVFKNCRKYEKDEYYCGKSLRTIRGLTRLQGKKVRIFLQAKENSFDRGIIGEVLDVYKNTKYFTSQKKYQFTESEFISTVCLLEEKKDVSSYDCLQTNSTITISDVYDTLIETRNTYFPCFLRENAGIYYESCDCCKYSIKCISKESVGAKYRNEYEEKDSGLKCSYESGCLYRFRDVLDGWNQERDRVLELVFDSEHKVKKLNVEKNGEIAEYIFNSNPRVARTLLEIRRASKARVIIARNIFSGIRVKVNNSNYFNLNNIKTMKGYIGMKNTHSFYEDFREIYQWNVAQWILEWESDNG